MHEYDDDDDEEPHIPKDGFPFGVSWVAHGLDLVAHKDLQEYLDSQARKQAQFYILQRARCMVVMIFSYIFIHLLYIHICITSHKINSLFLIFFFHHYNIVNCCFRDKSPAFHIPHDVHRGCELYLSPSNSTEQNRKVTLYKVLHIYIYIYASYPLNLDLHIISKYICFLLCICLVSVVEV